MAQAVLLASVLITTAASPVAARQANATAAPASPKTGQATKAEQAKQKGSWRLQVSKTTPQLFLLKASDAPLSEIAAELGRKLKVTVALSPVMQKQKVTIDFRGLTLNAALRLLAPHPYVDYESGGELFAQPKVLAVYLNALNEAPPSASSVVKSTTEALLIEGDTEEGTEAYEKAKEKGELPLSVSFVKNHLSVRAQKQPLSVVMYKIASELGVPFDLRYESTEVVDINFTNYALDQAMRSLSPAVRFYYRADLQNFEIQPLRIALVAPARI